MTIAAFVECIHNASLIIDDIQDNSVKRRGEDCCHIVFGVSVSISAANTIYFAAMNWVLYIQDPAVRGYMLETIMREMTNLHLG